MTGWIIAETGTICAAISPVVKREGTPTQRFRKPIMRIGDYVNGDQSFTVTRDTLKHWASEFSKMKADGVRVPMPPGHDTAGDPDKNRGWVQSMFVEGDELIMNCELIGEDGISLAKKADVSIYSPASAPNGKGNNYTRPITHVAFCTDPVVSGLGAFIPIAASLRGKESHMKLTETAKALGIELSTLTNDKADTLICSAVSKSKTELDGLKKSKTELEGKVETLTASLADASKGGETKTVDPLMVELVRDNLRLQLDACVSASKLTPAERDVIIAKKMTPEALTLALSRSDTGAKEDVEFWLGVISRNDPVKLVEHSRAQTTVSLSNPANDGAKESTLSDMMVEDAKQEDALAAVA